MKKEETSSLETLFRSSVIQTWVGNGGDWHFKQSSETMKKVVSMAKELPYAISVDTSTGIVGITHANPPED
jgi:hypothetical protein